MESEITKLLGTKDLLSEGNYTIPIYQRNYAWGESQIKQLIKDIWSACEKNKFVNYYIGTLIVNEGTSEIYEIIDGQQRHTTLSILLSVLKNEFANELSDSLSDLNKINLDFDARKDSKLTLDALFDGKFENKDLMRNSYIYSAYNHALKELRLLLS